MLPQGHQEQAALTASQEKRAGQAEEVAENRGADSGRLEAKLFVSRAELISQQAEDFLNLRGWQHRFDEMGECAGVHLQQKNKTKQKKSGGKTGKPEQMVRIILIFKIKFDILPFTENKMLAISL